MLHQCWSSVIDGGPPSSQHWVDVSCLLGIGIHLTYILDPWLVEIEILISWLMEVSIFLHWTLKHRSIVCIYLSQATLFWVIIISQTFELGLKRCISRHHLTCGIITRFCGDRWQICDAGGCYVTSISRREWLQLTSSRDSFVNPLWPGAAVPKCRRTVCGPTRCAHNELTSSLHIHIWCRKHLLFVNIIPVASFIEIANICEISLTPGWCLTLTALRHFGIDHGDQRFYSKAS